MTEFEKEIVQRTKKISNNKILNDLSSKFMDESVIPKYSYNFQWLGRPIIQYPQDIVAMQEIIWRVKPDLIIEVGIAHGGSLIFSASLLAMIDVSEKIDENYEPKKSNRKVLGVDIDIRSHNKIAIESHPMSNWIEMIEGSSISSDVVGQVRNIAEKYNNILVCLDSNHTHEHVLEELRAYADLTSVGSYCVVFDTMIEDVPAEVFPDRPWGPGDNPKTAVHEYLKEDSNFAIDNTIHEKLLISAAPEGYLKRIK
jgi:cephalosporin hydroxylase|tara:strand:- start:3558 stop:4322 length:765 start_codon:yes stop_codon:yes gene_type:complete